MRATPSTSDPLQAAALGPLSGNGPRWRLRRADPAAVERVARSGGLSPLAARILVARGMDAPEEVERHLAASPMALLDPDLLPDMDRAAERAARAVRDGETILVHGDYDVDGVTGTALLVRLFRLLDARVAWHIPDRIADGYSFGDHSVERARAEGAGLVVSVDNGTSERDVIARLAENGVDTIVTDHHEPPAGPLPDAAAIVNPKLEGSRYPQPEICGAAVAFKLAWGVARAHAGSRRVPERLRRFLEEAAALVAVATVCDVVPLVGENRVLARFGLKALSQGASPGLTELARVAGLAVGPRGAITAEDVAFQIGPRINASGRIGSAARAVELLLTDDVPAARRLARELDAANLERREIEAGVLAEAREEARRFADPLEHPVLVLAGRDWHPGVVGIVAARIAEEHGRPSVVVGLDGDLGRGSARTVDGFHVLDALRAGRDHMERFGGHAQAAGLEIHAENVPALRAAVCAAARAQLAARPIPAPELTIDAELPLERMTADAMRHLDRLSPFGQGNPRPVLLSRAVHLGSAPRVVGASENHLLLQLRSGEHALKAMGFRLAPRRDELALGRPFDAVYSPRWNTFRGETRLELELLDFAPTG